MSIIHSQNEVFQCLMDVVKNINLDPINMANKLNQTPLYLAVYTNQSELVQKLIRNGAKADVVDRNGNNVFHIAVERDFLEIIKILAKHCDLHLLNALNYVGFAPLHIAVQFQRLSCVRQLCELGANINVNDGTTGSTPLQIAVEKGNLNIIKYLLQQKEIDIDGQNFMGNTALHLACLANNEIIVEMLVSAGADTQIESANPLVEGDSSDDEDKNSGIKEEFQGCRPIDLEPNEKIRLLLEGKEDVLSQEFSDSSYAYISDEPYQTVSKVPLELKSMQTIDSGIGDSGIGISGELNSVYQIEDDLKNQLAEILDKSEIDQRKQEKTGKWRSLTKILDFEFLDYIAEKEKSPTKFLLNYIEDIDVLQNALEAMGLDEAVTVVKNYRANKDSRPLHPISSELKNVSEKLSKFSFEK